MMNVMLNSISKNFKDANIPVTDGVVVTPSPNNSFIYSRVITVQGTQDWGRHK